MRVLCPLMIAALLAAGCGAEEPAPAAKTTPAATATATAEKTPSAAGERTKIMALVKEYWQSVSSDDPQATCATLAPSEQRHFEKKFGSCEKAFSFTAKQREGTGDWRAGVVELDGERAEITTVGNSGGQEGPNLYAVREDGEWGIARKVAYRRAG